MPRTHFLNVDLEVRSRRALAPLIEALSRNVVVLHHSRGLATMELYALEPSKVSHRAIEAFVRLVRRLPPTVRRIWDGAQSRRFDLGIQAGSGTFADILPKRTIAALAEVGGELAITVYPLPQPERRPKE